MKKQLLSLLVAGSLGAWTAQGATLIEFNFDERTVTPNSRTRFEDQSGNGRTVEFNRVISLVDDYPFEASHPELDGYDKSAVMMPTAATQGTVENVSDINLRTNNTFTMEGWIYLTGFANIGGSQVGGTLWSLSSSTGGTSVFSLYYTSDGTIYGAFNALSQSGGTRNFDTKFKLELNQ